MDAQLLLERDASEVVAPARPAVLVGQELGHDEKRQALAAGRAAGRAGEHHVHDVFRQIVFAIGDEDLLAGDAIRLTALHVVGLVPAGAGRDCAQVGTGLGLGEIHGAGPGTGYQMAEIGVLLGWGAVGLQQLGRALGQERREAEAHVGRVPGFLHRHRKGPRQTLAAIVRIERQRDPSPGDQLVIGVLKARRHAHHAVLEHRAFLVARLVERRHDLAGELPGFSENGVGQVRVDLFEGGKAGQLGKTSRLLEGETHVRKGGAIVAHDGRSRMLGGGRRWPTQNSAAREVGKSN